MTTQKKWVLCYFVGFITMIFLNYWSTTNVGSVATENQAIIQPAGYAFSIWGAIYLLIFIWLIKLYFSKSEQNVVERLKLWPLINFLFNGLWILTFTAGWIGLSTIVIFILLFTIVKIYLEMTKGKVHWFYRFPFSIYFAWVSAASIVNIFTLAVSNNIEIFLGLSELSWTMIALVLFTSFAVTISFNYRDWLFPLVTVWAYIGIFSENNNFNALLDIILILSCVILIPLSFGEGLRKVKLDRRKN